MPEESREPALPVRPFLPRPVRPLMRRAFAAWLRSFSWRSGILLLLLAGATVLFACVKDPWRCIAEIGEPRNWFVFSNPARSPMLSPDGRSVLVCEWGAANLLDADGGRLIRRFLTGGRTIGYAWFTPDGRRVIAQVYSSKTTPAFSLVRLDPEGAGVLNLAALEDPTSFVSFSPDGSRMLYSPRRGRLAICDLNTGRVLEEWQVHDRRIRASYQGAPQISVTGPVEPLLGAEFAGDGEAVLCWTQTATFLCARPRSRPPPFLVREYVPWFMGDVFLLPDRERFLVDSPSGPPTLWRIEADGAECTPRPLPAVGELVCISADGRMLMTWQRGRGGNFGDPSRGLFYRIADGERLGSVVFEGPHIGPHPLAGQWPAGGGPLLYEYKRGFAEQPVILDSESGWAVAVVDNRPGVLESVSFARDAPRMLCIRKDGGHFVARIYEPWCAGSVYGVFANPAFWLMGLLSAALVWSVLRDMKRGQPAVHLAGLPRQVRFVAYAFGVPAALGVLIAAGNCAAGIFIHKPATGGNALLVVCWNWLPVALLMPNLFFAMGLLRRNRAWRLVAFIWMMLSLLPLVFVATSIGINGFILTPRTDCIQPMLFGQPALVPELVLFIAPIAWLAVTVAQLILLQKSKARAAFR